MDIHDRIAGIIEPSINAMGYGLVQIRLLDGKSRRLQVMAERLDGRGMTVDDCADISHQVSALLDVEDPIKGQYTLEISSPGIDRPLIKPEDFTRFAGFEAKLETKLPIEGRKRYKGALAGFEEGDVLMEMDGKKLRIPFSMVQSAKLVLTDALIDWHGKQAEAAH